MVSRIAILHRSQSVQALPSRRARRPTRMFTVSLRVGGNSIKKVLKILLLLDLFLDALFSW